MKHETMLASWFQERDLVPTNRTVCVWLVSILGHCSSISLRIHCFVETGFPFVVVRRVAFANLFVRGGSRLEQFHQVIAFCIDWAVHTEAPTS